MSVGEHTNSYAQVFNAPDRDDLAPLAGHNKYANIWVKMPQHHKNKENIPSTNVESFLFYKIPFLYV